MPQVKRFRTPNVKHRKGVSYGQHTGDFVVSSFSIQLPALAINDTSVETRGFCPDVRPGDVVRSLLGAQWRGGH